MALNQNDFEMLVACDAAKKDSHDPTRPVGAVLVNKHGAIAAVGTNRPPQATELTTEDSHRAIALDDQWKYFVFEHAERDALAIALNQKQPVDGGTMYVSLFPCADCARAMVSAGIKRVVAPHPTVGSQADEKWASHFQYAQELFSLAGVEVELFAFDPGQVNPVSSIPRSAGGVW